MSPPERAAAPGLATEGGAKITGEAIQDHDTGPVNLVARLDKLAADQAAMRVQLITLAAGLDRHQSCVHACADGDKLVHLIVPDGFKICAPCVRRANGGAR